MFDYYMYKMRESVKQMIGQYLRLIRAHTPNGTFLLFFPCLWGILLGYETAYHSYQSFLVTVLLFFCGAFVMRSVGCIINDVIDRNVDQKTARTLTRPIANGAITRSQALTLAVLMLGFGAFPLFLLLSTTSKILSLIAIPLIGLYPLAKRFTSFPQVVLGIVFNYGMVIAFYHVSSNVFTPSLLLFYCVAVIWTVIYDTIYAMQDAECDKRNNVGSLAVLFGNWITCALVGLTMLIFAALIYYGRLYFLGAIYFVFVTLGIVALLTACILISLDPKRYAMSAFQVCSLFGLCVSTALLFSYL